MTQRTARLGCRLLLGVLVFVVAPVTHAQSLLSGEQIPIANAEKRGRLASGISTVVVGQMTAVGNAPAGIFTVADRHSHHLGLFLHPFLERDARGVPVFAPPIEIDQPAGLGKLPPPCTIFQADDGRVHGFWIVKNQLVRTTLDVAARRFAPTDAEPLPLDALPQPAKWIGVVPMDDGSLRLLIGIDDGAAMKPDGPDWRSPDYRPFDGAGVYRGKLAHTSLYVTTLDAVDGSPRDGFKLVTPSLDQTLLSYGTITCVDLGEGRERNVVTGSWFGNLYCYDGASLNSFDLRSPTMIADESGNALFHPSVWPTPMAYENVDTGRASDLLIGGQSAVYYYRFTGRFLDSGAPVYADPVPVMEQDAKLYTGSLPVLSAIDWDGDGSTDIVAGNSEGRVLWFRNLGSNAEPAFDDSVALQAGGEEIHILPGYGDVQGPQESRWGYTCPTVVDWNGDGALDIVVSGATARHEVMLNIGSRTTPELAPPRTIHYRGLDLHGTWRVQPGIAPVDGRMAYVALDEDDEFHLYWRIDDYNVGDGGKLRLADGAAIGANFLSAGGTGRTKIVLTDWDRDGKLDLLVGTPRHASIPDPEHGLPQSLGLKGAAVVFLRNVGEHGAMTFAFPTLMQFRGEPIYLDQHACSPAVWDVGQPDGPDLIAGNQDGRIFYYQRSDLTWEPMP